MLLGRKPHTAGNRTRYYVDYANWLEDGESLSAATVVMDPSTPTPSITISGVVAQPSQRVAFSIAGGAVNEAFTLAVQVTDSRSEIKNDTLQFYVIAP